MNDSTTSTHINILFCFTFFLTFRHLPGDSWAYGIQCMATAFVCTYTIRSCNGYMFLVTFAFLNLNLKSLSHIFSFALLLGVRSVLYHTLVNSLMVYSTSLLYLKVIVNKLLFPKPFNTCNIYRHRPRRDQPRPSHY